MVTSFDTRKIGLRFGRRVISLRISATSQPATCGRICARGGLIRHCPPSDYWPESRELKPPQRIWRRSRLAARWPKQGTSSIAIPIPILINVEFLLVIVPDRFLQVVGDCHDKRE